MSTRGSVVPPKTILERWEITAEELTAVVDSSPSLRGMMFGYIAELQLAKRFLALSTQISGVTKPDDHDRGSKGDRIVIYKGKRLIVESKSLQTNTVRRVTDESTKEEYWMAKAQVDASDCRQVTLPNGRKLQTTCLICGEFDLLAVNCFAFAAKWQFAFARNRDLPRSTYRGYRPEDRQYLLSSLVTVTWPPRPPFYADPFPLLEGIIGERNV